MSNTPNCCIYYRPADQSVYNHSGEVVDTNVQVEQFVEQQGGEVSQVNVRCPVGSIGVEMVELIKKVKAEGDSIGGCVQGVVIGLPSGLGEPVFDKLEALLAYALMSIPATKAFEIGQGFNAATMKGSQHNDQFIKQQIDNKNNISNNLKEQQKLDQKTNKGGGTLGGISNGQNVFVRVGFKPVSTIGIVQETSDFQGNQVQLAAKGRHDPCVVPRAVVIVESMIALVILDTLLIQQGRQMLNPLS